MTPLLDVLQNYSSRKEALKKVLHFLGNTWIHLEETHRKTQDMLEGLYLPAGLGMPRDPQE